MPSAECLNIALLPFKAVPVFLFGGRKAKEGNDFGHVLADSSNVLKSHSCREQYSHEPYVAVARFQRLYLGKTAGEVEPRLMERGRAALERLEDALTAREWLVGDAPTVADLALVAYTRVAHEGGFDLMPLPNLRGWIQRVETAFGIG